MLVTLFRLSCHSFNLKRINDINMYSCDIPGHITIQYSHNIKSSNVCSAVWLFVTRANQYHVYGNGSVCSLTVLVTAWLFLWRVFCTNWYVTDTFLGVLYERRITPYVDTTHVRPSLIKYKWLNCLSVFMPFCLPVFLTKSSRTKVSFVQIGLITATLCGRK
jgi:hypothetical protein